jgi:hypothetical protein
VGGRSDRDLVGFVAFTTGVEELGGGRVGEGAFVALISSSVLPVSLQITSADASCSLHRSHTVGRHPRRIDPPRKACRPRSTSDLPFPA